jgi:hypothetical protein
MPTMTETENDLDALDELEPLEPRPRRRLLTPIPLALMALLLTAVGFIGGVLVQKHAGGSSGTGGFPGAPAFAAGGGAPDFGGGGSDPVSQGTSGEVSAKKGDVIYVTTSDGTTVKVQLGDATVTRTAEVGANQIHPGDTVVVQGATQDNGTVKATSVTATQAGVSAGSPFGGGAPTQGGGSAKESRPRSSDQVGQLFGG